jgi:hypothetical protein
VKRLILWGLIFLGIGTSVPAVRERLAPRVAPARDYLVREVGPPLQRGFDPAYRWLTVQEMRRIGAELRRRELMLQQLPSPREFQSFLAKQIYVQRAGLDPWGTPYSLQITRDSIIILSAGPDKERGTADDIRESTARR